MEKNKRFSYKCTCKQKSDDIISAFIYIFFFESAPLQNKSRLDTPYALLSILEHSLEKSSLSALHMHVCRMTNAQSRSVY